jgi:Trk K+ transport system NAD-binding subunit
MQPAEISAPSTNDSPLKLKRFIVCGLGSLGQHCVAALREFEVSVVAIEQVQPQNWEIANLPDLLDDLIFADCRHNSVLEEAGIRQCRAALLVTSNEQVNIETALAIRQLNPHTRLVVRSAKENLNQLLNEQLGNFIAYEPIQLTATAFALAALGTTGTLGFFTLDGQRLKVICHQIDKNDLWCNTRLLHELNTRTRRLLAYTQNPLPLPSAFHQWEPNVPVLAGDVLIYIEIVDVSDRLSQDVDLKSTQPASSPWGRNRPPKWRSTFFHLLVSLKQQLRQFWQLSFQQQIRRVALVCGMTVLVLLGLGTVLFHWYYPGTSFLAAFYATAILLLGGYGDLFSNFQEIGLIPWWLQLFSLGLTLAGTAFVGVLYALLTEALLSSKFEFVRHRPPVPQQDHAIIIGLGRVGQQVATLLQDFKQALVGISLNIEFDPTRLPQIPVIVGNLREALAKANLSSAKSVVVITDDEILNLEVALMTKAINPNSHLVIRASSQRLSKHLTQLLPTAQVLSAYAVAAEAFAGAAFGENIINLFRLNNQTILVTEYQVEVNDTLSGRLLAEVAYGYGVVTILYQKPPNTATLMPGDDIRLAVGDRLVILATIDGLGRIEQGNSRISLKCWQVRVEKALTSDAIFEGANVIARISGCSLSVARELMKQLPGTLHIPLYRHQGLRLVGALRKVQVAATLTPLK